MLDEPRPDLGPIRRPFGNGVPEPGKLRRIFESELEATLEEVVQGHYKR